MLNCFWSYQDWSQGLPQKIQIHGEKSFKEGCYESCAQLALVVHVQFPSAQLVLSWRKVPEMSTHICPIPLLLVQDDGNSWTFGFADLIEFEFGGSRAVSKWTTPPSFWVEEVPKMSTHTCPTPLLILYFFNFDGVPLQKMLKVVGTAGLLNLQHCQQFVQWLCATIKLCKRGQWHHSNIGITVEFMQYCYCWWKRAACLQSNCCCL